MKTLPNEWLLNFQEIRKLESGLIDNISDLWDNIIYDYDENFIIPKEKTRTIKDLKFAFKQKINF